MIRSRKARLLAAGAATALLSLSLTGCISLPGSGPDRDEEGNVTEQQEVDAFSLEVGDCFFTPEADGEGVSGFEVVPCTETHDEEIYHEFLLPEGEYPGRESINAAGEAECGPTFLAFVGVEDAEASELYYDWYSPTEDGWNEIDDRLVQCTLFTKDASQIEGSMKDAAR